ncbi:gastrokine-1-like [Ambystoma mexicanum]|uniref:gastrokine-1-like n=1 Tax=Ambystoma mexicanum TaxID=8296 RepID=UPI0037E9283C
MQASMLIAALVGACLTQTFAKQMVQVNVEENVAFLKTEDGLDSKDTVLDYNLGVIATRLLSHQTCVVMMMNRALIPTLEQLTQKAQIPPGPQLSYSLMHTLVKDVAQFGKQVEQLCAGVPTRYAEETDMTPFAACEYIVNILGITICTSVIIC